MAKKNVIINKVPYEGVEEVKIPCRREAAAPAMWKPVTPLRRPAIF